MGVGPLSAWVGTVDDDMRSEMHVNSQGIFVDSTKNNASIQA
jgi:hypothetical protein